MSPGLNAAVTAVIVRRWLDRAGPGLLADVQRGCPPARQWETAHDERVRPSHAKADGQVIPGNLRFILDKPQEAGTEQARWPRDPALSAANKINCRCETVTIAGLIAATMTVSDAQAAGTVARITVSSRFPRIAESELGDGTSPGLHFMGRALRDLAARLGSGR
jgi:hypothetical protein